MDLERSIAELKKQIKEMELTYDQLFMQSREALKATSELLDLHIEATNRAFLEMAKAIGNIKQKE